MFVGKFFYCFNLNDDLNETNKIRLITDIQNISIIRTIEFWLALEGNFPQMEFTNHVFLIAGF